jgi:hypothetical protein
MKAIRVSEYGNPAVDTYLRSNTDNRAPMLAYTPGG